MQEDTVVPLQVRQIRPLEVVQASSHQNIPVKGIQVLEMIVATERDSRRQYGQA